ncbi:MAG: periplasmic heavy metal sensor [Thioalkalispiraceae bacterium]|jgi:Spy/CpxP family protein refolding chaperone
MKYLFPALLAIIFIGGGASMAIADDQPMMGMHRGMMHDGDNHPGRYGMMSGMMHGGMGMMGGGCGGWMAGLNDAQRKSVDKLRLDYHKKKFPIKARLKQAQVDLALLIASDKPSDKAINKKIDEILKLKGEKMRLKTQHKVAVRKLLDEDQRVKFDLCVVNKAYQGRHSGFHHP